MIPKIPSISKDLVDWMAATYPDRCPDPAQTEREIWMATGAAHVVRKLRYLYERQQEQAVADVLRGPRGP